MWSLTFQREKKFAIGLTSLLVEKILLAKLCNCTKKLTSSPEKKSKNSKKTTRRITSAICRIFAHLNKPLSPKFADKHALSKMNLSSMEVSFKLGINLNE